jgi:hypothetical protein
LNVTVTVEVAEATAEVLPETIERIPRPVEAICLTRPAVVLTYIGLLDDTMTAVFRTGAVPAIWNQPKHVAWPVAIATASEAPEPVPLGVRTAVYVPEAFWRYETMLPSVTDAVVGR